MRLVQFPEFDPLSRQLSAAWAALARRGDPGQKGLAWPACTTTRRETMVFDAAQSRAVRDPDRDERLMLRDLPSRSILQRTTPTAQAPAGDRPSRMGLTHNVMRNRLAR